MQACISLLLYSVVNEPHITFEDCYLTKLARKTARQWLEKLRTVLRAVTKSFVSLCGANWK